MSAEVYLSGRLFRVSFRKNEACISNGADGRIIVSAPVQGRIEQLTYELAKEILNTAHNTKKPTDTPQD